VSAFFLVTMPEIKTPLWGLISMSSTSYSRN
jgi:hypothetical protein